jgi:hypothetical protein
LSAASPRRLLIAFDGTVESRLEAGAINLTLRGFERHGGPAGFRSAAEALFASAATLAPEGMGALPSRLREVRIFELAEAPGARRFLIRAQGLQLELACRSLQLHRDAGGAFFRALPPPRVPLNRRLGWTLLLLLLRLPGAERLLAQLRGIR